MKQNKSLRRRAEAAPLAGMLACLLVGCAPNKGSPSTNPPSQVANSEQEAGQSSGDPDGAARGGEDGAGYQDPQILDIPDTAGFVDPGDAEPPAEDGACAAVSERATAQTKPVDIIWASDNSGSMEDDAARIQANMNAFAKKIGESGVDYRIVLLVKAKTDMDATGTPYVCVPPPLGSGQCPDDDLGMTNFMHIDTDVQSTDSLSLILASFAPIIPAPTPTNPNPTPSRTFNHYWWSFIRQNSAKVFVVTTDDNSYLTAAAFDSALAGLWPNDPAMFANYTFHGIYCLESTATCSCAAPGRVYEQLRQWTRGVQANICDADWTPVFDKLAQAVTIQSKLSCDWLIPRDRQVDFQKINVQYTPSVGEPRRIGKVAGAGECADRDGWYYDNESAPTIIRACPSTCGEIRADSSGAIEILFGCKTVVLPPISR